MTAYDRRELILEILRERGHEIAANLSFELGVSERTIRRDIDILSLNYYIYTEKRRGIAGIYLLRADKKEELLNGMYVSNEEEELLETYQKNESDENNRFILSGLLNKIRKLKKEP